VTVYTADQLQAALTKGSRVTLGRWEVLRRSDGTSKGFLVGVEPGSRIAHDYLADIKRTCSLSVRETPGTTAQAGEITWSSVDVEGDTLVPWFYLTMPDGGLAKWRKGMFIMEAGQRGTRQGGGVYRSINGQDQTVILNRDLATTVGFYQVAAGTILTAQVKLILADAGITRISIPDSAATLPTTRLWEQGTTMLKLVNELLSAAGYGSIFFDDAGVATANPYVVPADRAIAHTYRDDSASVIYPAMGDSLDVFDVPNRWVSVVSQSDRAPITSTFNNVSPSSPTSQVSRGYIVTKVITDSTAANQAALDTQVRQVAHEDSMVYRTVTFDTLTMPDHGEADIITLTLSELGIAAERWEETAWSMCNDQPGQGMSHTVRKVVNVDLTS
jgi:hypothetical protein